MKKVLKAITSVSITSALSFLAIVNFTELPAKADDCTALAADLNNWGKSSPQNALSVLVVGLKGDGQYASYFEERNNGGITLRYSKNVGLAAGPGFEATDFSGYYSDDRYKTTSTTPTLGAFTGGPFAPVSNTIAKHDILKQSIAIATEGRLSVNINSANGINPPECSKNMIYGIVPDVKFGTSTIKGNDVYAVYFRKITLPILR